MNVARKYMRQKDVTDNGRNFYTKKKIWKYLQNIFKENLLKIFFKEKNDAKFCFYRHSFLIT